METNLFYHFVERFSIFIEKFSRHITKFLPFKSQKKIKQRTRNEATTTIQPQSTKM